jgi:hypothetical protein
MATKYLLTILYLFSFVVFSSCELFKSPYKEQSPLTGKVVVFVSESQLSDNQGKPQTAIDMQTEKIYPCANYQILYDFYQDGNILIFMLRDVAIGDICLTAFGPALLHQPLTLNSGIYHIEIAIGNKVDQYVLAVTDSAYQITSADTNISRPFDRTFWRFPKNSFIYMCSSYGDMNDGWVCDAFVDTLKENLPIVEVSRPSYGVFPYPTDSYFVYPRVADFDSAGALLKRFSKKYLTQERSAYIILQDWLNKRYASAVLRNQ